jgi:cholesterol oxidase
MAQAPPVNSVDVVVIGSGFGGSVAANRLALAGQRVLVLERGPWRDSLPVRSMGIERRSPFPYGIKAITHLLHSLHRGGLHLGLNKAGMFELFSFAGLTVMAASGVGGGSMAYGGLLEAPLNSALWKDRHPQLDPNAIERYYDKVITDMGGVRLTREHALPQSIWTHLPDGATKECHPAAQQPHIGLLMPRSASEIGQLTTSATGIQRQFCTFDGDSFLGSRGGAKASVDFIYLAPVLNQGATVRDLCEVTRIQPARPVDGGGYLVHFRDLSTKQDSVVQTPKVVMAAGTMNTLKLLFASSNRPSGSNSGLVAMPSLGKTFGANGDMMAIWPRGTSPHSSLLSTPYLGEFKVNGCHASSYGMGGFPGVGALPIPPFIKRMAEKIFLIFGMGQDSGNGSVDFVRDHLRVKYSEYDEPIYKELRAALAKVSTEHGGTIRAMPKPFTVHQWGGCAVGADADHGVIDHRGEVYGNPGLFVADGAALPAATGGPPSLGIAAWAHHVADGITNK